MRTEKQIQSLLLEKYRYSLFKFTNTSIFDTTEIVDFADVKKSGYIVEYEIKRTVSDFNADFKKPKHQVIFEKKEGWKKKVANRFYYVVPEGKILPFRVPSYAGLMYVNESGDIVEVKAAPLLHKHRHEFRKRLWHKMYNAYLSTLLRSHNDAK